MFHSLSISNIIKETPDCVSIELSLPKDIQDNFKFKPGQYLTFKQVIEGEEVRRSYSICSSCTEYDKIRVAVKQVENGKFSTYANQTLQVGDVLDSMKPMGNFIFEANSTSSNTYLLIAAGSGITPVLSILDSILHSEPNSNVILLYGNKNIKHVIFKEAIEGLKNQYLSRFTVHYFLSRQSGAVDLFNGHINADKIARLGKSLIDYSQIAKAYICGPEEMIHSVKAALIEEGLTEAQVKFELFTSSVPAGVIKKKSGVSADKNIDLTVVHNGKNHQLKISEEDCILDVALESGTDLPFACKGGVCATCKAKLDSGTVDMNLSYGLEQEEIDEGYILTCQAFPTSKELIVNFDKAL